MISELVCVVCVPERPVACDEKPGKISDMFKALFKNDQAMTVVVSIILVYTSLNICGTLDALRMWMTIPSVILLIVGIFVFKRFYKLDDTRMEEIKSKLN